MTTPNPFGLFTPTAGPAPPAPPAQALFPAAAPQVLLPWQHMPQNNNLFAQPVTDGWQRLRHHVQHKNIANYLDEKANRRRYAPGGVEYNRGLEELKRDGAVKGGKRKSRRYRKSRKYKKSRKYRKSRKR